jgi:hypothetical protein
MDTGKGGCNGNLLYGNDFSHSPANGIEATFSSNTFLNNLCVECDYGIWGGYSYDTLSQANVISACRIGMAFEHSQNCSFTENQFYQDKTGIQLWGTGKPDPNFGYAKNRDVRSQANLVRDNTFDNVSGPCIWLRDALLTMVGTNYFLHDAPKTVDTVNAPVSDSRADVSMTSFPGRPILNWDKDREYPGDINALVAGWNPYAPTNLPSPAVKPLLGGMKPFLPKGALRGRKYMLVDEWGPYDFRHPRLWPRGEDAEGNKIFEVLGPKGKWSLESVKGAKLVGETSGKVPDFIKVKMPGGSATNVNLKLKYVGAAVTDYRGITTPAGKSLSFSYSQFFSPINWTSEFFQWDKDTDPREHDDAFRALLAGPPIATTRSTKLDFSGFGAWAKGVPRITLRLARMGTSR